MEGKGWDFITCGLNDLLKLKCRETKEDNTFIYFVKGYKFPCKLSFFFESPLGFTEISDQARSSLSSFVEHSPLTQEVSSPPHFYSNTKKICRNLCTAAFFILSSLLSQFLLSFPLHHSYTCCSLCQNNTLF